VNAPAQAVIPPAYRIEKLDASASLESFQQLAKIHVNSIHGGIMEALGPHFLAMLYQRLSTHNDVLMFAARRDFRIIGFVAGTRNVIQTVRNIGFSGMINLFLAACASAWRPTLLRKIVQTIGYFYRRTDGVAGGSAVGQAANPERSELLAIAVREEARGQGVGRALIETLEREFQTGGGSGQYFVSTNQAEIGSNAFYQAAGFALVGQKRHHDLMLNIYKKELAP
jgi:ribosomal protein S18 acetylase RimI-like enzyme